MAPKSCCRSVDRRSYLLGRGFQLAQVAATLTISQNTASSHVKSIYRKLNISTRAEAVAAIGRGLMGR